MSVLNGAEFFVVLMYNECKTLNFCLNVCIQMCVLKAEVNMRTMYTLQIIMCIMLRVLCMYLLKVGISI